MANDTIVIRYTIELVVSSGGALSGHKAPGNLVKPSVIQVHWLVMYMCMCLASSMPFTCMSYPSLGFDIHCDIGTQQDMLFGCKYAVYTVRYMYLQKSICKLVRPKWERLMLLHDEDRKAYAQRTIFATCNCHTVLSLLLHSAESRHADQIVYPAAASIAWHCKQAPKLETPLTHGSGSWLNPP